MAILAANPSNIRQVAGSALAMDLIELGLGKYQAADLLTRSNLSYRAIDSYGGRPVEDGKGHLGAGMGVILEGPLNCGVSNVKFDGGFHDTRGYNGINAGVISGDNVEFWNWSQASRPRSGVRQIGYTLGTGDKRISGFAFINSRGGPTGQVGEDHDHFLYLKNTTGHVIRDSIINDGGWFPLHFYTNGDNGLVERVLIWNGEHAITFSGASDGSTGSSEYRTSDGNRVTRCILHGRRTLLEEWTSDESKPTVGNIVDDNVFVPGPAPFQLDMQGVTVSNERLVTPVFADVAAGDFRMPAGSPAVGYGPRQIQPGYVSESQTPAPPAPPTDEELHELLAHDLRAIRGRLTTVESWTRLTESQRASIIQARNRAQIGIDRLQGS